MLLQKVIQAGESRYKIYLMENTRIIHIGNYKRGSIRDGYVKQCCSNCGYDDYREVDMRGPYIITFLDGDPTNHDFREYSALLCYNCFFIMKPTGKMLNTPKNTNLIRKKLEQVWEENEDD